MLIDLLLSKNENYTINIIDTLESIYINFKQDHNNKIKEIFELIDIEVLIRPELLKISNIEKNIIKNEFGTEFNIVEYEKLITDLKAYFEYNKLIKEIQKKQYLIEQTYMKLYKEKESIEQIDLITKNKPPFYNSNETYLKVEGYSNFNLFMKAEDYRLCSIDTLELDNQENSLIPKTEHVKECYILFLCNTCVVLENESYNIDSLLENFKDIKLIDKCVTTPFKDFLHKKVFNNFIECKSMYDTLKSTLPKETIDTLIENQVKNYINWNYNITENVSDRIKALELYNLIKKEYNCTIDSRQFSKILLKLNLKKKRYQDGIYYYGLKKYNSKTILTDIKQKLFNGLLREREPIKEDEHLKLHEKMLETRTELDKII